MSKVLVPVSPEAIGYFESNVLVKLRFQVGELVSIAKRVGARYAWECATGSIGILGTRSGPFHGAADLVRFLELCEKYGMDGQAFVESHEEFKSLREELDRFRGWGDEPVGSSRGAM